MAGLVVEIAFSRDSVASLRGFRVAWSDGGILRWRVEKRRWRSSDWERVLEMMAVVWRRIWEVVIMVVLRWWWWCGVENFERGIGLVGN